LKEIKKKKYLTQEAVQAAAGRIFLSYFALNLQSAHKMWGRKVQLHKERLSYGTHQQNRT